MRSSRFRLILYSEIISLSSVIRIRGGVLLYNYRIPCKESEYSPEKLVELARIATEDKLVHNQNFIVIDEDTFNGSGITKKYSSEKVLGVARYDSKIGDFDFINHSITAMGAKLNPEQCIVYHYVMNVPDLLCMAVTGKAGTGKNFVLALSGLHKLSKSRKHYSGLAYTREIGPMGKDPGALPGELADKTREYYAPLFQNIAEIASKSNSYHDQFESDVEFVHVATARGRSVMDKAVWIIDEFQNFHKDLSKHILSRAGSDTLVGICGSSNQIDTKGLTENNNGLTHSIEKFSGQPWFTHIELVRSERQGLSAYVDDLL
ncbi:PhoH [Listeria phage LIS04]|nr:PhoH [Listeria phage LIS04]